MQYKLLVAIVISCLTLTVSAIPVPEPALVHNLHRTPEPNPVRTAAHRDSSLMSYVSLSRNPLRSRARPSLVAKDLVMHASDQLRIFQRAADLCPRYWLSPFPLAALFLLCRCIN
ncbi:hypothetical protein GGX14DRAFT_578025 [Mycena pura]|uniref:Uncharacterized protein n=1 Tax=Mycena pura TaxID=153505 RepID=A0AAD6Y5P3_9AGAR|nr:hypothetical protein GGX14DRAFT_578025 [Mycena pura]